MKKLFLFALLSPFLIVSQTKDCNHALKGQVLDADTQESIPFAIIKVRGSAKYTTSDKEGNFIIDGLCSKKNTLIISCVGYSNSIHNHEHDSEIHFYLEQEVTGLEGVTIEAKREKDKGTKTIAQVTIGKNEVLSNPTQSLGSLLSNIDGVTFTSKGNNVQLPIIHGLYGNRILVLNNGLKHGFQNWGTDHAPEIDVASAGTVTVIKGASGVRYGPEALGGAIIVEPTSLHLNNPLYAEIGTSYQTNGRGYNANFEIGKGNKNWSYFLNGSFVRIGDRHAPDYNLTNSGKEENALSLGLLHHIKDFDFKVFYSYVDQNLGLLRSSVADSFDNFANLVNATEPYFIRPFSYNINEPNQITKHHLAKAEITWWHADSAKLTFRAGAQLNQREEFDVRRDADLPIIDLDLLTYDYLLEWEHPEWNGLEGFVGIQYYSQNNDNNPGTNTTAFIPNYNTNRFSAFILESYDFGKNIFEVGFRLDHENNDVRGREISQRIFRDNYSFTNITGSIGYERALSKNSFFRTNLGTAWRTPNVAELFSFGAHGFKNTYGLLRFTNTDGQITTNNVVPLEDSNIKAEQGYKFTNEFEIRSDKSSHKFTLFANYIKNFIFDRPIGIISQWGVPAPAYIYDQANSLFLGADYTWKKQWSKKIRGTFGLSYLWSRNVSENEPLINQPPISLNYEAEWDQGAFWFFDTSKWTLRPSYTFEQFQAPRTINPRAILEQTETINVADEIFDFIDAPEGFFLFDFSWNFGWKNLSGGITIQNVLNTSYRDYLNEMRYFADEQGRNILFRLNYKFQSKKFEYSEK